ncbi:MAG TPA: translation initiation factor IF-3, partial [Limnochordales bacterium]
MIRQEFRINEEIRAREVRVVSPEGQQLGVMPLREALRLAHERDMDLVEVAPYENPPVCRIMNYGKYKYEQSKKDREARKRQKIVQVKEIRMTPKIEEHDFDVKARNIERFLRDGDKVKVTVRFRGREIVHADLAKNMLQGLVDRLHGLAVVERPARIEGRAMVMMLAPRPDVQARARAAVAAAPSAATATATAAGASGG